MISLCDMIKFAKYIFCRAVSYWINMLSRGQVLVQSIGILGGGKTLYSTLYSTNSQACTPTLSQKQVH